MTDEGGLGKEMREKPFNSTGKRRRKGDLLGTIQ